NVRSEMDGLGIHAGGSAIFFDDGAPTFMGIVSIIVAIGLILVALKVIPEQLAGETEVLSGSVMMEVSWTDKNGISHDGKIWIELYNETPMHAQSFRANADSGRYDGTIFHRIVDGFMIQGGDFENGDGTGGHAGEYFGYCANAGFTESTVCENDMTNWVIPAEFGQTHDPGVIAAARSSNDNSAGSQFYLVDSTGAQQLDGSYTAFGKAYKGEIDGQETTGIAVIDAISQVGCGSNQDTCTDSNKLSTYPVTIEQVTLVA
ncbi:MAG: peptidylprolyl isomerase, partial [Candidatus Thermoplasmatota archaeon]|nr:peptidylprolyl isomerase [Candidatus Thermoplasmatota archaeon]